MGRIKNILLTGANGFLGSHLLAALIKNGYKPIAYLRPSSDTWRIEHLKNNYITFISADNSSNTIEKLFNEHEIDAIFHTATNYGRDAELSGIIETNVLFPLKLIEAGIKHQLKLFVNTDTFFGKKQFVLKYLNNYTTSKRMLESLLPDLTSKINIANLRIEHVYGENDSASKFVTSILKQLIKSNDEILLTEGLQKRDFVYIDDVINAYITILQNEELVNGYQEFEVGTGQSVAVKEFVLKMADAASTQSMLKFGALPTREGEIADSYANTAQLNKFGWKPQYDIDTAINKFYITEKKRYTDEN
jgi:nucleoside-diphosphate-sugar epimerase